MWIIWLCTACAIGYGIGIAQCMILDEIRDRRQLAKLLQERATIREMAEQRRQMLAQERAARNQLRI